MLLNNKTWPYVIRRLIEHGGFESVIGFCRASGMEHPRVYRWVNGKGIAYSYDGMGPALQTIVRAVDTCGATDLHVVQFAAEAAGMTTLARKVGEIAHSLDPLWSEDPVAWYEALPVKIIKQR